jgi:hypothetical protein
MSNDKPDPIGTAFGLEPLPANEILVVDAPSDDTESYDMETARQNIHHLIQKGTIVLDDMIDVARQSQHPRAFEVTANLIKTLADVNQSLIDLQEKKKKLSIKEEKPAVTANTVNNIVYTGSTADFQDMLEKIGKK